MRPDVDPVITDAKRRMLAAAGHYERAIAVLLPAMRALERHPDYARTVRRCRARARSAEALTLAYWLHSCCSSGLNDGGDDAGKWLREDATGGAECSMELWIDTEERDLARIARKRRARGAPRRAPVAA